MQLSCFLNYFAPFLSDHLFVDDIPIFSMSKIFYKERLLVFNLIRKLFPFHQLHPWTHRRLRDGFGISDYKLVSVYVLFTLKSNHQSYTNLWKNVERNLERREKITNILIGCLTLYATLYHPFEPLAYSILSKYVVPTLVICFAFTWVISITIYTYRKCIIRMIIDFRIHKKSFNLQGPDCISLFATSRTHLIIIIYIIFYFWVYTPQTFNKNEVGYQEKKHLHTTKPNALSTCGKTVDQPVSMYKVNQKHFKVLMPWQFVGEYLKITRKMVYESNFPLTGAAHPSHLRSLRRDHKCLLKMLGDK